MDNLTIKSNVSFDFIKPNDDNYLWHPFNDKNGWSASLKNGYYILENAGDPFAVNYIYLDTLADENIISLDVKIVSTKENALNSNGGLLLNFDKNTKYYYAFTINSEGNYNVFKRDEKGLRMIFSNKFKRLSSEKFVKLAAVVNENGIAMYINDELVKQLKIDKKPKSDVGLIALGKGKFFFDNLMIYKQ